MTQKEFEDIAPVVGLAQRLHGRLHAELIRRGAEPIDALIASLYATQGLASAIHGPAGAIDWMRNGVDEIERQMLAQVLN